MSFSAAIGRLQKRFNNDVGETKRRVMLLLFGAVVKATPVGNADNWNISDTEKAYLRKIGYTGGRLRAAWHVSRTPAPAQAAPDEKGPFADPMPAIEAAVKATVTEDDGAIYLVNPMPYARRIEYEGWSKVQAPAGMVRTNLIAVTKNLQTMNNA